MEMLSNGSSGDAVTALQRKLFAFGFDPGTIDGIFGPKTDQAVRRYQEQKGLQVDGIAGPKTLTSLGMMSDEQPAAAEAATEAAPERQPMQSASAATEDIDAQRSAQQPADDKPAGPKSKGLRARMAARKEARRNRGR